MSNDNRFGMNKEQDNKPGTSKPAEKASDGVAKPVISPASSDQVKEEDNPESKPDGP